MQAEPASSDLIAAELAHQGFSGAPAILEGHRGFYKGCCPDAKPERLLVDAAGPWLLRHCSIKPWPCCRHTHASIDARLAIYPYIEKQEPALI